MWNIKIIRFDNRKSTKQANALNQELRMRSGELEVSN